MQIISKILNWVYPSRIASGSIYIRNNNRPELTTYPKEFVISAGYLNKEIVSVRFQGNNREMSYTHIDRDIFVLIFDKKK